MHLSRELIRAKEESAAYLLDPGYHDMLLIEVPSGSHLPAREARCVHNVRVHGKVWMTRACVPAMRREGYRPIMSRLVASSPAGAIPVEAALSLPLINV